MAKRNINIAFIVIGLIGLIVLALISVIDSQASNLLSVIPAQILFASLFIGGYISYQKSDKK